MRAHTWSFIVGLGFLAQGCTSTGSGGGTETFTLSDGTYVAHFPRNYCGTLTINGGSMKYTSGPCGGATDFSSGASFDGNTIRIKAATYRLSSASKSALVGTWRLGNFTTRATFKRQ